MGIPNSSSENIVFLTPASGKNRESVVNRTVIFDSLVDSSLPTSFPKIGNTISEIRCRPCELMPQ